MTSEMTLLKSEGVRVVLNGGSRFLESATIPAQWFFDPEIVLKEPVWILVSIQHDSVFEDKSYSTRTFGGDRYIFPVTDRIGLLQVFKPGRHRVTFIARTGEQPPPSWFTRKNGRQYNIGLDMDELAKGDFDSLAVGFVTEEIEVPAGLFAPRSANPIAQAMWKWVNRWHENEPRDQCQYRARAILAFTAQPFVVGVAYILRYLFALLGTLTLAFGRLATLFCGYRPEFLAGVGSLWNYDTSLKDLDWRYRYFSGRTTYLVWKSPYRRVLGNERPENIWKMPISPWAATLLFAALSGFGIVVWFSGKQFVAREGVLYELLLPVGLTALGLGVVIGIVVLARKAAVHVFPNDMIMKWRRTFQEKLRARMRESQARVSLIEKRRHDTYISWLGSEMAASRAPQRVDFDRLPAPFKNTVIHKVRVTFLAAKIRVCKPFSRT